MTLHLVQTWLFYDGLAQDVPEWTSQWSVIVLLAAVLMMENQRRGLVFGRPLGIPKTGVFGLYDLIGIDLNLLSGDAGHA